MHGWTDYYVLKDILCLVFLQRRHAPFLLRRMEEQEMRKREIILMTGAWVYVSPLYGPIARRIFRDSLSGVVKYKKKQHEKE